MIYDNEPKTAQLPYSKELRGDNIEESATHYRMK